MPLVAQGDKTSDEQNCAVGGIGVRYAQSMLDGRSDLDQRNFEIGIPRFWDALVQSIRKAVRKHNATTPRLSLFIYEGDESLLVRTRFKPEQTLEVTLDRSNHRVFYDHTLLRAPATVCELAVQPDATVAGIRGSDPILPEEVTRLCLEPFVAAVEELASACAQASPLLTEARSS